MTVRELIKFLCLHPDRLDDEVLIVAGDDGACTPAVACCFASWVDDGNAPDCVEPGKMYLTIVDSEE